VRRDIVERPDTGGRCAPAEKPDLPEGETDHRQVLAVFMFLDAR
jgi:hypothetical protein